MNGNLRKTALFLNLPSSNTKENNNLSDEINKEQSNVKVVGKGMENGQSIFSPMTELAINFQYSCTSSTPRRRLSLSDVSNTPTPVRSSSCTESIESGIGSEISGCSSDFENSPTIEAIRPRSRTSSSSSSTFLRRKAAFRRSNSSQASFGIGAPLRFEEENEEDPLLPSSKSVRIDTEEDRLSSEVKEAGLPSKLKPLDSASCTIPTTLRSYSAPPVLDSLENYFKDLDDNSPREDGFIDCFDDDVLSEESSLPSGFSGLLQAPILSKETNENSIQNVLSTCSSGSVECFSAASNSEEKGKGSLLFKRPSMLMNKKTRSVSLSTKRPDPPRDFSPLSRKRYRSQSLYRTDDNLNKVSVLQPVNLSPLRFGRSLSVDCQLVEPTLFSPGKLFGDNHEDLIGDRSRTYALPCTVGRCQHPDLKGITPETLVKAMNKEYTDLLDEIIIIDCRYPYEYKAGHIKDAINIYEKEEMIERFLKHPKCTPGKKLALIFHCEFSSKRGPGMCRFLRNKDRDIHKPCYPKLYYPELYILEGGYKAFFSQCKEYCEPQFYLPMCDTGYTQELKHFAKRSKSWTEGSCGFRTGLRY